MGKLMCISPRTTWKSYPTSSWCRKCWTTYISQSKKRQSIQTRHFS